MTDPPSSCNYRGSHIQPNPSHTHPARTQQAAKAKAQQDRALKEKQRLKRQAKKEASSDALGAFGASPSRKRGRSMAGLMGVGSGEQPEGAGTVGLSTKLCV